MPVHLTRAMDLQPSSSFSVFIPFDLMKSGRGTLSIDLHKSET